MQRNIFAAASALLLTIGWASAQECGGGAWLNRTPPLGGNWRPTCCTFDSRRGVTVMLGGAGELWELSDGEWMFRSSDGPESTDYRMVYDSDRGVCVATGGGEVWEWNGEAWSNPAGATAGPGRLRQQSLAYDSARREVVMFGGINQGNQTLGETWAWNGKTWRLAASDGPGPRAGAAMCFDSIRDVTVMHGPDGCGTTWEWDGAHWHGIPANLGCFQSSEMFFDSSTGQCVIESRYLSAMWDGRVWTTVSHPLVPPHGLMKAAYDSVRHRVILLGPMAGEGFATWSRSAAGWSRVDGCGPSPSLLNGAMSYDASRDRVVFIAVVDGWFNTWEWDGNRWDLRDFDGPPPRIRYTMATDGSRGQSVLFGGSGAHWLGDTWEWNGAIWRGATPLDGPAIRWGHAMSFDSTRERIVLYGGSGVTLYADTWEWDGQTWTNRTPAWPHVVPFPVSEPAMAFDPSRGRTVLFGGNWAGTPLAQTLEWDGTSWYEMTSPGPIPQYGSKLVYRGNGRVMLLGVSQLPTWLWEWDGVAWHPMESIPYGGPVGAAWDSRRQQVVALMSAGTWIWQLATSPSIGREPINQNVPPGRDIRFDVSVASLSEVQYQWFCGNDPLKDGGRVSGAKTASLRIADVAVEDGGTYRVHLTNQCGETESAPASLVVQCSGDWNADQAVDSRDFFDFLVRFFELDADFNADGITNSQDFFGFLAAFFGGC
jgi:hypothetical protein